MSKYRYEMGGIIRDTEIDFPYDTDEIVELLDEKDQRISELEEQLKNAIVPKFKYGQECYIVCDKNIIKCKIYNISNSRIQYECEFIDNPRYSVCRSSDCVYATKEEAQAKLKKCEKLQ